MAVDQGFALALRDPATYQTTANASLPAGLQASALESEIISPFWDAAAASAEGAREIAFLGGPNALDRHVVPGQRNDLVGRAVTITADRLGYSAGRTVFVIDAEELENNLTRLIVLRRLT